MTTQFNGTTHDTGEQSAEEQQKNPTQDQPTAPASDNSGHMVPKSRLDAEIQKRKAQEQTLAQLAEDMKQELPEQFRGIVPEGLPPAEQIAWMRKATASGLFSGPSKSPDTKRPSGQPPTDFQNMSPQSIMAQGYNK